MGQQVGLGSVFNIFQKDDQPLEEESLIALVQTRVKNADATLQELHRTWFTSIAMRRGNQWIQSNPQTGVVINPPEQEGRVRVVINKMAGIHQTRVSKLIKDMPKLEVIPASSQDEDKDLARVGTKLLAWVWQNERMVEKIIDCAEWTVDTGNCFFYVYWDADKGTEIPTYQRHEGEITEDMPHKVDADGYILDANGERIEDAMTVGDVAVDVIDPFCIVNDGVSTSLQDSHFIIIRQAMSLKDIRMKWPERGGDVRAENDLNTRAYYQRRLMAMSGNQASYFTPESKQYEDMAVVDLMFERRSDKYPKGRRAYIANGVLLEAGDMPFDHGLYPLIKVSDLRMSGGFWDCGTMEICVPVQKGCNRAWSQIIENGNFLGNIKAWVNKGHGLTKEAYDDTGFEVLELNQGFQMNQLQPASLPAHVINQLQWYDKAFEDVTGQHEVSQAKVPAGVKSGRAIIALQEQDDTRLAPTKMRFYRAIEEIGYMALQLYAQFQEEDREYQIVGGSTFDINEFKVRPGDIKSMKKDVRIQTENIIAAHKRIQQENAMEMYEAGLFGDKENPEVRKKVLQILEIGNIEVLFDEIDQDTSQAKRENEQFINREGLKLLPNPEFDPNAPQGLSPEQVLSIPAYDFEDHEAHVTQHNKLRKSMRYRQMSDSMRKGLDLHVKVHQKFLSQKGTEGAMPPPPPAPAPRPRMAPPPPLGAIPPSRAIGPVAAPSIAAPAGPPPVAPKLPLA